GERIRLEYTVGDIEGHKRLVKKLDWAMDRFDDGGRAITRHHFQVTKLLPLYGVAHMCGTTRFGADPRTSVLDRNCKAWELDNLYVADASFFPSSSAVNPTLTIVANAMRVADHLKERLGVRDPSEAQIAREVEAAMAVMAIEPEISPVQAQEAAKRRHGFSIWPFGR
ncbi:MAG: GMC family oxidoreductase, partial [Caulobacterales bacterium]